ncbi:hypothetical protein C8Q74DRAFT_1318431 [Fomes fomentarius]|nr:hypothetical protein C8Q74DRAFT_1318431 [Fomes fomentarius]
MAATTSLADLSLFPATPDQVHESRTRHAEEWARNSTLEEYLLRDVIMDKDEHAANGNLITWVLAPRSHPRTLDFLCSCETFRRTAVVAKPSTDPISANVDVEEVTAYGIASVFTPARNRKKGYARHMMRLLHWVLAPRSALQGPPNISSSTRSSTALTFPAEWGTPPDIALSLESLGNAHFSVLYSDVGREFYRSCGTDAVSRNGWVVTGATETSWILSRTQTGCATPEPPAAEPVEEPLAKRDAELTRLTESDVLTLYTHDARWIKDDLAAQARAQPPELRSASGVTVPAGRTLFSFLPDKGVGAFVIRRTINFTTEGLDSDKQPVLPSAQWGLALLPGGARTLADALDYKFGSGEGAAQPLQQFPFVTWTLDVRGSSPRTLVVARLRADERTLPVLLDELLVVAREEKLDKVEVWYLRPELRAVAEARGWTTKEREEHLSAVKWYGDEDEDKLDWVYNEKFCWC